MTVASWLKTKYVASTEADLKNIKLIIFNNTQQPRQIQLLSASGVAYFFLKIIRAPHCFIYLVMLKAAAKSGKLYCRPVWKYLGLILIFKRD